jgi:hypothetical protein
MQHQHLFPAAGQQLRLRDMTQHEHHPWRRFSELTAWELVWVDDLPDGKLGRTVWERREVEIMTGLEQAERRCTIDHEVDHILGGPTTHTVREEARIRDEVARRLIPSIEQLCRAMALHHAQAEMVADELWVDEDTLNTRLSTLTPSEKARLDEQLATILI